MTDLRDQIATVLVEHSYDIEIEECLCGYRPGDPASDELALHVAGQILTVLAHASNGPDQLRMRVAASMGWKMGRRWDELPPTKQTELLLLADAAVREVGR